MNQGSWENGPRSPDLQELDLLSPSGLRLGLSHSYHRSLRDRFRMVAVPASSGHCLLIPISQRGAPPPQSKGLACAISGLSGTLLTADSCFQSDSDVKLFPRPLTQFLWVKVSASSPPSQAFPVPWSKSAFWSVAQFFWDLEEEVLGVQEGVVPQ